MANSYPQKGLLSTSWLKKNTAQLRLHLSRDIPLGTRNPWKCDSLLKFVSCVEVNCSHVTCPRKQHLSFNNNYRRTSLCILRNCGGLYVWPILVLWDVRSLPIYNACSCIKWLPTILWFNQRLMTSSGAKDHDMMLILGDNLEVLKIMVTFKWELHLNLHAWSSSCCRPEQA